MIVRIFIENYLGRKSEKEGEGAKEAPKAGRDTQKNKKRKHK